MTELSARRPSARAPSPRRRTIRELLLCGLASAPLLCAAMLAVLLVNAHYSGETATAAVTIEESPDGGRPVSQEGTLIAVSADSLTARSADGYIQTYRVTPDTTFIAYGGESGVAASRFAVDDQVVIVGTVRHGRALATTVAYRDMSHGLGPPMDYSDGRLVSVSRDAV